MANLHEKERKETSKYKYHVKRDIAQTFDD